MRLQPISKLEAARYMGVQGEPDKAVMELLDKAEETLLRSVRPMYVYRETSLKFTDQGVCAQGMNALLTGRDIAAHLEGCSRAVLLAATLTSASDKLIRQAYVTGMADSLAMDCLCSAAVEQVCDRAEEEIFNYIHAPYRTWRFSPGYGDLPLELQSEILLFLNAGRRIGLTATENHLLIPSKSVTAIIGISDTPINKGNKGCQNCNMRDRCAFSGKGGCGK